MDMSGEWILFRVWHQDKPLASFGPVVQTSLMKDQGLGLGALDWNKWKTGKHQPVTASYGSIDKGKCFAILGFLGAPLLVGQNLAAIHIIHHGAKPAKSGRLGDSSHRLCIDLLIDMVALHRQSLGVPLGPLGPLGPGWPLRSLSQNWLINGLLGKIVTGNPWDFPMTYSGKNPVNLNGKHIHWRFSEVIYSGNFPFLVGFTGHDDNPFWLVVQ